MFSLTRGQHLCKFIGTKESVCITKKYNSQRIGLGDQHGRCFIVLGHQYGRRDVMWKLYNIQSSLRGRRLKGKGKGGRLHSKIRPNWTLLSHPTPHSDSFQIINRSGDGKDHAIASWWCKESDKAEVEKTRHCEKMESAVNFPYSILSTSNVRRFFWGIYLNAETKSLHLSSTHLHLSQNYLTERNRKDRLRIPQLTQQTQYLFPPLNWQFSYTANLQFSVRLFHCNFLSGFDT